MTLHTVSGIKIFGMAATALICIINWILTSFEIDETLYTIIGIILWAILLIVYIIIFVLDVKYWHCPHCKKYLGGKKILVPDYCSRCGRKIDGDLVLK